MGKIVKALLIFYIFCCHANLFSQNSKYVGRYYIPEEQSKQTHTSGWIYFKNDGTFVCKSWPSGLDLFQVTLKGNWYIEKDSILILNSNNTPKETLITEYTKKSKAKKCKFAFYNEHHCRIFCNLFIIHNGDTVLYQNTYRNNFKPIVVRQEFDSFYFFGSDGCCSKTYKYNPMVKEYEIIYDNGASLKNEMWIIKNDSIKAYNVMGRQQDFLYIKQAVPITK